MIDYVIGFGTVTGAFALGWILRGMLCLRRGGCDALANDQIATLERDLEIERMVSR